MDQVQQLLLLVDAFGRGKMADATISTRLFNDGKRISILRNGGDIGTRRLSTAIQWFSNNWPTDAEWPSEIEKPPSSRPFASAPSESLPASEEAEAAE